MTFLSVTQIFISLNSPKLIPTCPKQIEAHNYLRGQGEEGGDTKIRKLWMGVLVSLQFKLISFTKTN